METLGSLELARLLLALTLLLVAAHTVGYLANRIGQPRVIGEIVGGLLLGPTVLGAIAPGLHEQVFPADGPRADRARRDVPARPAAADVQRRARRSARRSGPTNDAPSPR